MAASATGLQKKPISESVYTFPKLCQSGVEAILFGLTAWSIPTIMAAAAGDFVGPRLAPAGLGFITLFFGIGQAVGPALGGVIFADDLMHNSGASEERISLVRLGGGCKRGRGADLVVD